MWKEQEHCVIKRKVFLSTSATDSAQTSPKLMIGLFPFQRHFTRATDEAPEDTSQLSFLHRHILAFEG